MSEPEDNGGAPEEAAFARLEGAISQLVDSLTAETERTKAAETKNTELADLVRRFTGDEAAAGQLMGRLKGLETENTDLRGRLEAGRAGVERMIARIKFLENQ
ncbi:MAG: hypothetical protein JRH11_00840 [Deltaproteobacteria bacterium]|nr:hypothetical protein [Deltaproteobacteria bacterium]